MGIPQLPAKPDGKQTIYITIFEGDLDPSSQEDHQKNVEKMVSAARKETEGQDVKILVIGTQKPKGLIPNQDQFVDATSLKNASDFYAILGGFIGSIDGDDHHLIYPTGHGSEGKDKTGLMKFPFGLLSLKNLSDYFRTRPVGSRFWYLDLCHGGASPTEMINTQTGYLSLGANETVSCQQGTPYLLAVDIPDQDGDPLHTSVQERVDHMMQQEKLKTNPQCYLPTPGATLFGKTKTKGRFQQEPITVHDGKSLKTALKKLNLKPCEQALVIFSADQDRCPACTKFKKEGHLERFAQEFQGRFPIILAEGEGGPEGKPLWTGTEQDWVDSFNIHSLPSVAFIDRNGKVTLAESYLDPMTSFIQTVFDSEEDQVRFYLQQLFEKDTYKRRHAAERLGELKKHATHIIAELKSKRAEGSKQDRRKITVTLFVLGEEVSFEDIWTHFDLESDTAFRTLLSKRIPELERTSGEVSKKLEQVLSTEENPYIIDRALGYLKWLTKASIVPEPLIDRTLALLNHPDPQIKRDALEVLAASRGRLRKKWKECLEWDGEHPLRYPGFEHAFFTAHPVVEEKLKPFVPKLISLLDPKDPYTTFYALLALAKVGKAAAPALPQLARFLKNPSQIPIKEEDIAFQIAFFGTIFIIMSNIGEGARDFLPTREELEKSMGLTDSELSRYHEIILESFSPNEKFSFSPFGITWMSDRASTQQGFRVGGGYRLSPHFETRASYSLFPRSEEETNDAIRERHQVTMAPILHLNPDAALDVYFSLGETGWSYDATNKNHDLLFFLIGTGALLSYSDEETILFLDIHSKIGAPIQVPLNTDSRNLILQWGLSLGLRF